MAGRAKRAAREAQSSTGLRLLARGGYVANGVVHVLIGAVVLVVALGGRGEADQSGAFQTLAAVPAGFVVLWVIAVTLWALALWHLAQGLLARGDAAPRWGTRLSEWGQSVAFAAVGAIAVSVALGARPDADETAQDTSRGVLAVPGGVFLLGTVGLGVAIGGIVFIVLGVRRTFEKKMTIRPDGLGRTVVVLGVTGFIAKGVALGILGVLLVVAAAKVDPDEAGGLDSAVDALIEMPSGPLLAAVVGVGLIAYGVFCGFRGRYARL